MSAVDQYISNISTAKIEVEQCARVIDTARKLKCIFLIDATNLVLPILETHTIIDEVQGLKPLLLQLNNPINRSASLLSEIHDSFRGIQSSLR